MNKREAREILFTLVFESEFHPKKNPDEIYDTARAERGFENFRYIKKGLRDIVSRRETIVSVIEPKAHDWKVSRMTTATRAILFVGVYDIIFKSTSPSIAINEAVELAKKFAEDDAAPFINGILDSIAADAEAIKADICCAETDDAGVSGTEDDSTEADE